MHYLSVFHRVACKCYLTGGIYIRYNEVATVIYLVLKGGIPDGSSIRSDLIVILFQIKLFLGGNIDTVAVALAVEKCCVKVERCALPVAVIAKFAYGSVYGAAVVS